jgi:hypothetical protein
MEGWAMNNTTSNWQRVSKRRPCPICAKPDWCMFAGPADSPRAAICARVESPKHCGEAGWLHVLRDDGPAWPTWRRTINLAVKTMSAEPAVDFAKLAGEFQQAVRPEDLAALADCLGLSVESLVGLRVGWSKQNSAWSFPMIDADGNVQGIRLRLPDGRKLAVRGGREGLFIPSDLDLTDRVLVCEGPTDTAALVDLGFAAIGRPSCTGGTKLLVGLVERNKPSEVVIVADGDLPGQRGAQGLATVLLAYAAAVRIIAPPAGIKDARAWKLAGAAAADVRAAIDTAPVRKLKVAVASRKAGRHD